MRLKPKILVLLLLGALATGSGVLAANESQAAKQVNCCGFCVPGEACEACDLKKAASNAAKVQVVSSVAEKGSCCAPRAAKQAQATKQDGCCGFCVPGEACEACDLKKSAPKGVEAKVVSKTREE